jgi:hypothetical protein
LDVSLRLRQADCPTPLRFIITPDQEARMRKVIAHCKGRIDERKRRPDGIVYAVRRGSGAP